jgi:[protein-PII] uridylyltransferase
VWNSRNLKRIDRALREHPEANRLFLEILTSPKGPERTLRRMTEAQVFGRFIPDFGRVVAQMQYDMYHVYTVDEHTIFMLGILHKIEKGALADVAPVASEVVHEIASRRALYVAALLHDIAKGRGGDHSILGAKVARRLCPRLGLSEEETETVAWLVRWHLLMSHAAFKRDVNDSKTIRDFTEIVQSPERLRLLLVLTVADIRAVGPNVWNGWKAALLRELYWRGDEQLSGNSAPEKRATRVRAAQDALRKRLTGWEDEEADRHVARGYAPYWLAFDTDAHADHAWMMREAERRAAPLTVDTRVHADRDVTEVTIYTHDHPGLFSRIAGAMAAAGANIVDARIFTMADGMALDVFWVQDEHRSAFDRPDRLAKLSVTIERALAGRMNLEREIDRRGSSLPKRAQRMTVAPRVIIHEGASVTHTVIEVNGTDRPGVLWRLTRVLSGLGLQISAAKISTYGESIVDVFYVKDVFGLKVDSERKLSEIRDALLGVLKQQEAKAAAE